MMTKMVQAGRIVVVAEAKGVEAILSTNKKFTNVHEVTRGIMKNVANVKRQENEMTYFDNFERIRIRRGHNQARSKVHFPQGKAFSLGRTGCFFFCSRSHNQGGRALSSSSTRSTCLCHNARVQ